MNVLFVPTLALDISLLDRLADSVDCHIQHKVVFNNGHSTALLEWQGKHPDWVVLNAYVNLGVAGSWNKVQELFPHEQQWLICNDDIWFPPGVLQKFCEYGDANLSSHDLLRLNDSSPYYCFIHSINNINDIGTFDENFWPAYYEDSDYNLRSRLLNMTIRNCFSGQNQVNHGKPKCGGIDYNAMIQGCGLWNRRYWESKWGAMKSKFKYPFNNECISPKEWTYNSERRLWMTKLFDAFMESPQLYD